MFQNLTQFYHALYYFIAITFNQSISQTIIQWWFLTWDGAINMDTEKGVGETDLVEGEGQ